MFWYQIQASQCASAAFQLWHVGGEMAATLADNQWRAADLWSRGFVLLLGAFAWTKISFCALKFSLWIELTNQTHTDIWWRKQHTQLQILFQTTFFWMMGKQNLNMSSIFLWAWRAVIPHFDFSLNNFAVMTSPLTATEPRGVKRWEAAQQQQWRRRRQQHLCYHDNTADTHPRL